MRRDLRRLPDEASGGPLRYYNASALVAVAVWVLASCARAVRAPESDEGDAPAAAASADEPGAILAVENNSIFDVRVYVLRAGQRYRLGLVGSGTTITFPLGRFLIDREIALYAEPVGARGQQRTDAVYVRPGQEVRLQLERRLRSHHLAVY